MVGNRLANSIAMTPPKAGHFSWNELVTADTSASADFYGRLFGWKAVPFGPEGGYVLFKTNPDEMGLAGMMAAPQPGMPTHWQSYVVVDDADASLEKAASLGAKVLMPVTEIPNVGRIALIADPQGAVLGFHELVKR